VSPPGDVVVVVVAAVHFNNIAQILQQQHPEWFNILIYQVNTVERELNKRTDGKSRRNKMEGDSDDYISKERKNKTFH
jgi:hypothetical protein